MEESRASYERSGDHYWVTNFQRNTRANPLAGGEDGQDLLTIG